MSASLPGLFGLLESTRPFGEDQFLPPSPSSPTSFDDTSSAIFTLDSVMYSWNWQETQRVLEQVMSPRSVTRYYSDLDFAKLVWEDMARELRISLVREIRGRLTKQQVDLIRSAMSETIMRTPASIDSWDAPKEGLLYRYWTPDSHSRFDPDLGICCSLWEDPKSVFSRSVVVKKSTMTHHMNGSKIPSPFISMASSPGYLLNNIGNRYKSHEKLGRVIIYNFRGLQEHSSWPVRSTDLADSVGITKKEWSCVSKTKWEARLSKTNGEEVPRMPSVEYISRFHWLAVGRLRNECIRNVVSLATFREVCKSQSIVMHSWNRREISAKIWDSVPGLPQTPLPVEWSP